ncbi:amino acid adenylation domain-containing protein, partial [Methylobacterium sp. M6A4_1b]
MTVVVPRAPITVAPARDFVRHLRGLAEAHGPVAALHFLDDPASGEITVSYAGLDRRARAVAARLQGHALPGDRVALMLETGLDYVAAFFGCLYAGLIAVPAFPPEARRAQHQARLSAILTDSEPAVILVHREAGDIVRAMPGAGVAVVVGVEDIATAEAEDWRERLPEPDGIAFLQYTSGSTASPKGVVVGHATLMANERAIRDGFGFRADDVMVSWLPLYHDMGLIGGLLQPIHAGIPAVLMSPRHFLGRPARWPEAIHRHRGTVSGGPDFAFRLCHDRVDDETLARLDLSSWQVAFSGSEMVRAATMADFAARFAPAGFDPRALMPCYGLAEATLFVTAGRRGTGLRSLHLDPGSLARGEARETASAEASRLVECGVSQEDHPVRIADPAGAFLPEGVVGEVRVSGPSLAQGYWRNPAASAETFPEVEGRRWLRTGDLGFLRAGRLFLVGRAKDLIILRGQNVYPQDVERVVEAEVDILRQGRIAAFGLEREGREGIGVAVEVSRSVQKLVRPEALAALVAEAVADAFLETARVVVLLNPGGLPRTSSGKIQRGATRQGWQAGSLDAYAVIEDGRPTGARARKLGELPTALTPTEALVAGLFARVLGRTEQDRDSHFFAQGGDSLGAIRLLTEIHAATGLSLPAATLFAHPRLGALAQALDRLRETGGAPAAIPRADRSGALALSPGQDRLWFEAAYGDGPGHHIAGGLRLDGPLDRAALETTLSALTARHEAFRTRLRRRPDGRADAVIDPVAASPDLPQTDLSGLDDPAREEALAALSHAEAEAPFTLDGGILARFRLVRCGPESHVLLITMHHLVSDGWSMRVILREWPALYAAAREGQADPLKPLPIQPVDVAAWQRDPAREAARAEDLAWWRARLGGPEPELVLSDRARPTETASPGRLAVRIDPALGRGVAELARATGTSPFAVLTAAFALVLSRFAGTRALRLALPVAGRQRPETEGLVGLFVNTLVIPVEIDPSGDGRDLVVRVWSVLAEAQAHAELPFERLVEALQPRRLPGRAPLAQVMISQQPTGLGPLGEAGGLGLTAFGRDTGNPAFDLVLEVAEHAEAFACTFAYRTALFDPGAVARIRDGFLRLLGAVVAEPARRVDLLPLVTEQTRLALSAPYPGPLPLADDLLPGLIARAAAARPDAPAVICGDTTTAFAALDADADRLAHALVRRGVRAETIVAVALPRSARQIAAFLAVLRAGGAFLPLDPGLPPARIAALLADAEPRLVLGDADTLARLAPVPGLPETLDLDALHRDARDRNTRDPASPPAGAPDVPLHPDQIAYVIHTSGSSGRPKGVAVAHGPLAAHVRATGALYETGPHTRELHVLSMSFDGAHERWMVPLAFGACLVLKPDGLWTPREALDAMERHRVSHAGFPTAYMHALAIEAAAGPPPSPRSYAFGGEALSRESFGLIARALRPRFLVNGYGPTETVISPLAWKTNGQAGVEDAYAPIGRAVGPRRALVLDPALEPVPVGVTGELYLAGACLARGYLGQPGQTAARFLPDPYGAPGARLYRTGDLARWRADGTVAYLGRADAQVKLRGFRIELGEVEAALLAQETVAGAAAALRDGPAGPRLVGYVVAAPGAAPEEGAVRAALARRLPDYLVPARIVMLAALPLTPGGKLDRAALPAPADGPAEAAPARPLNETEATVARIWAEALGLQTITPDQNFF